MSGFRLDERLQNDTIGLASWPLSEVLLMNDSRYPWVILVPRRPGVREIYELSDDDQSQLLKESVFLGQSLMRIFGGDKLNVAALGNLVNQLHVHHVVRFASDASWPAPVWGKHPPKAYEPEALSRCMAMLEVVRCKCWQE